MSAVQKGSLICIGTGMMLGGHLTPRARSAMQHADVVFLAVSHPVVEKWLESLHPDVRSLQDCYQPGVPRDHAYQKMVNMILHAVGQGQKVCAAFYGHPGVFACVAHRAIDAARKAGVQATMEPGISAADCLYADLGIDPGKTGCQHYEATQFLFYRRIVDPAAYLILWQVGIVGDATHARLVTGTTERECLLRKLRRVYPEDHPLTIYEAATLPLITCRQDTVALKNIVTADFNQHSTLVIPPIAVCQPDNEMRQMLEKAGDTQQNWQ